MSNCKLSVEDFILDGEYGCENATLKKIGDNHFEMKVGIAPNQPLWQNKPQFIIKQHAKGNALRLDVKVPIKDGGEMVVTEYSYSYSYDNENWTPIDLKTDNTVFNTFLFPEFTQDTVYFGHQVPFSYERMVALIEKIKPNPYTRVHEIGTSLRGRTMYRIDISDWDCDVPPHKKWGHHFINMHPGEHNSQWRMVGMIDWLLLDEAKEFRKNNVCRFVLISSVDAPSCGWYRVNAEGYDMNRSYLHTGSDKNNQAHEAYICQKDLEKIMESETPAIMIWNMHTWGGIVEPIMNIRESFPTEKLGEWTNLRDAIIEHDISGLIKPLKIMEKDSPTKGRGLATGWDGGPNRQFGISGVLCEGGGIIKTKKENKKSGIALIKGISTYFHTGK